MSRLKDLIELNIYILLFFFIHFSESLNVRSFFKNKFKDKKQI